MMAFETITISVEEHAARQDETIALRREVRRLRDALSVMSQYEPCDCGCPGGQKPMLMKPHHYHAIARDALEVDEQPKDGGDVVVSVAGAEAYLRAADQIDSGAATKDLRAIAYAILDTCRKNALELTTPNAK